MQPVPTEKSIITEALGQMLRKPYFGSTVFLCSCRGLRLVKGTPAQISDMPGPSNASAGVKEEMLKMKNARNCQYLLPRPEERPSLIGSMKDIQKRFPTVDVQVPRFS